MTRLHRKVAAAGVPALFVHGSYSWGTDTPSGSSQTRVGCSGR